MRAARAILTVPTVLAALWLATPVPHAQQPPLAVPPSGRPHFRSAVRLTTVTATVTDAEGHLITGLPQERFEVFEDGRLQDITQFTSDRVPVSLGILLDASDSMYGRRMADARGAIDRFVAERLGADDEYALTVFNHQQQVLTGWTADRALAMSTLAPVRPWGATAIYDAIMAAIPMADDRHKPRAALLVVSDGADTASDAALREVRRALRRTDLFVYAVGIDSKDRRSINAAVNPTALAEITDQSGGRTRIVHDSAEVTEALTAIADELNSQYLIGYLSSRPPDSQFHSIRVRVKDGAYKVRARDGYVG